MGLVQKLHGCQKLLIGEQLINAGRGVAQGSVLSPLLFNVYLEEIILRCPTLNKMAGAGRVLIYADDMVWIGTSGTELKQATEEFNLFEEETGARINTRKSYILGDRDIDDAGDDPFPSKEKIICLGMTMYNDPNRIIGQVFKDVQRYLAAFKGRLRGASMQVKQALLNTFTWSLLIYFASPMVAAEMIKVEKVERWERELLRKTHLLPRDIDRRLIVNLARTSRPAAEVVARVGRKIRLKIERQSLI